MTATPHPTTAEITPAMPPTTAPAATADDTATARTAAGIGRRAWEQFADNPLPALFGTAIVALLIFNFTTINLRIDDINGRIDDINGRIDDLHERIDDTNDRITRLEDRMTRLEDRMTALEDDVAEINLKLTALIASLNRSDEVDASLEGRLLNPAPIPAPVGAQPQ